MKQKLSFSLLGVFTLLLSSCSFGGGNSFTITWENFDGSTLEIDTDVPKGTVPTYDGPTPMRTCFEEGYSYYFKGWTPAVGPATKQQTYTAVFEKGIQKCEIKVSIEEGDEEYGTVSGGGEYEIGSTATIVATPNKGYEFDEWRLADDNNKYVSNEASYSFKVEDDGEYAARFSATLYSITYDLDGGYNPLHNSNYYTIEDELVFEAPEKRGYVFTGWVDENGDPITKIEKGSTGDVYVKANWSLGKFRVYTISSNPEAGHIDGGGEYDYKSEFTITAVAHENCYFMGWYPDSSFKTEGRVIKDLSRTYNMGYCDLYYYAMFYTEEEHEKYLWDINHGITLTYGDKNNKTVTYGMYPQTIVSDKTLVSDLNNFKDSNDPNEFGYYFYEKEYYVYVEGASPLYSNATFTDGTKVEANKPYWFKVEPIKWKYDDRVNYYFAVSALDRNRYNPKFDGQKNVTDYKGDTGVAYANNYKFSSVRTYLNTTFYEKAFFLDDSLIKEATFKNDAQSTFTPLEWKNNPTTEYACENTIDKISLPSREELGILDYDVGSSFNRRREASDYFVAIGGDAYFATREPYSTTLTRSPLSSSPTAIHIIDNEGAFDITKNIDSQKYGVAPIVHLDGRIEDFDHF